jgi:L-amino acid N-acyltransferase YncA
LTPTIAVSPTTHATDKTGRPFLIRPLEERDFRRLTRMYESYEPKRGAQGLPPVEPAMISRWLARIAREGRHVVVEAEGEVVGHGMLIPFAAGTAELANFLHQSVRDRGIGTVLNRALIDEGRGMGLRRIWLSVQPSNRRAIRSYEKVGFRHRPATVWAPEIEMELDLQ